MNGIIYLVGLVVIVLAILSFFGLRENKRHDAVNNTKEKW